MNLLPDEIETRLREEIANRGLVLLDLKQRGERGSTVIEVIVDSETELVTLDEISSLSRWISALLDESEEQLPSRYRLEVSSAGLARPLEHGWQYRKNIGRLLKVTFRDDAGTVKSELYRLVDALDEVLLVAPKTKKVLENDAPLAIPLERITRAVVEPEF